MLRKNEPYSTDYGDLTIGIAKIPTQLGLKWLGNDDFLTVSSLFPAAYFDSGYEIMLKRYPEEEYGEVYLEELIFGLDIFIDIGIMCRVNPVRKYKGFENL